MWTPGRGRVLALAASCVVVAAGGLGSAAGAQTSSADCGETVITSVNLTGNLTCPQDGLVVGADGITVSLGGFTISGSEGYTGINLAGHSNVTISDGAVRGFSQGIVMAGGSGSQIVSMLLHDSYGIVVTGETLDTLYGNTIEGGKVGVLASATVATQGLWGVRLESNFEKGASQFGVFLNNAQALIVGNQFDRNGNDGIYVGGLSSAATFINGNIADSNGHDGIKVLSAGVDVQANRANRNHDRGIEAEPGEDGGGNLATGNHGGQCLNVVC